jgi:spore coat polysaccharide biosynthesis protein SpsF
VIAIVLQARMDSSRLPGKSLLPLGMHSLGARPLIFRVMEALNHVPANLRILACPEDSAGSFAPLAEEAGFDLFTGPKEDVLERYCMVIRHFNITQVIRATGDNPFVFADAAAAITAEAMALGADYAGYSGLPLGAGVEAVNAAALLCAGTEAAVPFEREHVCPFLYTHPEQFLLHRPLAPLRWQGQQRPAVRLTVDTPQDYERAQALYAALEKLRNEGNLSAAESYRGTAILNTYREIFPEAAV